MLVDLGVRIGRGEEPGVEHARELHVDGVAGGAGGLLDAVGAEHASLADDLVLFERVRVGDLVVEGLEHPLLLVDLLRLITHGRHPLPWPTGPRGRPRHWPCRPPAHRSRRWWGRSGRRRTIVCLNQSAEYPGGLGDRPEVGRIGPAAAEVAHHGFLDLVDGGVGIAVEEGLGRHDEARRAETALHAAVLDVGVDERVIGSGDALDSLDGVAPSHSMASIMHERTGRPSMITLQAPQAPSAQNSLVPVRPSFSIRTYCSVHCGSTANWWTSPLTASVIASQRHHPGFFGSRHFQVLPLPVTGGKDTTRRASRSGGEHYR